MYFENQQYQDLFTRQQERYRLYGKFVKEVVADTQVFLADDFTNISYWKAIKTAFSEVINEKTSYNIDMNLYIDIMCNEIYKEFYYYFAR